MTTRLVLAATLVLSATLVGCADDSSSRAVDPDRPSQVQRPTEVPAADGPVRTRGPVLVLDDGDGPEVCLDAVALSDPPQCSGLPLVGWEWREHPEHERSNGTRWGDYALTGTFDGTAFTPTEAVPASLHDEDPEEPETDLTTRCEEPGGGWSVVDAALTTPETMDEAFRVAQTLPGYAGGWMGQSINPASTSSDPGAFEEMNDPTQVIINVALTQDLEAGERRLREVWGGALCVVEAQHTERELQQVYDALSDLPGVLGGGSDAIDSVELSVLYDDGSIQAWADQEYGEGLVTVVPALVPARD